MTGPTSKLRIPEKPCGINQTQIDRLRLLTLSTSSKVASLNIISISFRPRLEFSKPKTAWNKVLVSSKKLPLVQNLLELCQKLQIWHVSTHPYVVSENIPFSAQAPLILLMSVFFCKKLAFFVQKSTFTQSNSVRAVFEIFLVLFSVFQRQKVTITKSITFAESVSRIRLPDCSKLAQKSEK